MPPKYFIPVLIIICITVKIIVKKVWYFNSTKLAICITNNTKMKKCKRNKKNKLECLFN